MNNRKNDWMKEKWRPAMGWMYMVVCVFDFVIFPILWSIAQALVNGGQVTSQWSPVTLQGAGLFHMAMGAVLGVAAWSRGQEKLAGASYTTPIRDQYQDRYEPEPRRQFGTYMNRSGKLSPYLDEPEL